MLIGIVQCVQDDELNMGFLDFVKLKDPEEIKKMIVCGYNYAMRMDAAGHLARHFGNI